MNDETLETQQFCDDDRKNTSLHVTLYTEHKVV